MHVTGEYLMSVCDKCNRFGLHFQRPYTPEEFLHGNHNATVWIVGLNPKGEEGYNDSESPEKLLNWFSSAEFLKRPGKYYTRFGKVLPWLLRALGKEGGVAHTDLVKCYSPQFPPSNAKGNDVNVVIQNCIGYLSIQIKSQKPKIIICHGSPVGRYIEQILPPPPGTADSASSYISHIDDLQIVVIRSGFLSQMDNYAKTRLGSELAHYLEQMKIDVHGA
jgi:uracil-DNA glycosylase